MWASAGLAQGKAPDGCEVCNALYSLYVLSGIKHQRRREATHVAGACFNGRRDPTFPMYDLSRGERT